jgi:hypothetical protein
MNKISYFFLILNILYIVNTKSNLNTNNSFLYKYLRNLWEEDMVYYIRNDAEKKSLSHCASSSYKYFSFIQTGAPVTFNHTINLDNAVSI